MQQLQCCNQHLFAVVNWCYKQLPCCSQYHFAVVDETVAQSLQSILVRNRRLLQVMIVNTSLRYSWCNGCSVAVNTVNVCNVVVLQLQTISYMQFALSILTEYTLPSRLKTKTMWMPRLPVTRIRTMYIAIASCTCVWSFQKMPTNIP